MESRLTTSYPGPPPPRLPGLIEKKTAATGKTFQQVADHIVREIPARRFGKVEEIAAMAAFLASPAAAYVNGASIPVDGCKNGTI